MEYLRLVCFDFDDTLLHTPRPEDGKPIWLEKKGVEWQHIGWWGKKDSIDPEVFDIKLNDWVYDKYLESKDMKDTFIIMATGRLKKVDGMREHIDTLLEMNNLTFDEVHLNWGGATDKFKMELFEKKIEELGVEEFIMYDDRKEHLPIFEEWGKKQKIKVTIVDVVNKTIKTI